MCQTDLSGFLPLVFGKNKRLQFVECPNDINGVISAAKTADLALLHIDGSYGFEMRQVTLTLPYSSFSKQRFVQSLLKLFSLKFMYYIANLKCITNRKKLPPRTIPCYLQLI